MHFLYKIFILPGCPFKLISVLREYCPKWQHTIST